MIDAYDRAALGPAAQRLTDRGWPIGTCAACTLPMVDVGDPVHPTCRLDYRPPIVGASDPPTSHRAAAGVEPRRGTAKAAVLAALRAAGGRWIPGHALTAPDVGGSEGLRRLRELSQAGFWIERRPGGGGSWEYRLREDR